ncbi:MAG: hypothetical protein HQL05_00670 [Nitrospirae bacterium]|uniref:alpha-amylase C-terminal beta-sheet domain-containing protein n=1 Tax=Candidatus Magnetobacterium casense TaxID=1455061 RepID=UPI00058E51ED|nr:alpha-amylase C-terminal beta-sheet domain-containing protein [Candidatus Magnetobacterium casensis]MBF0336319.1 hypothetical protein [Nitrospirota bacterium]
MDERAEDTIKKQMETLSEHSSKIKRIYLELNGYAFFHGPSEVDNADSRFIGRKRLIDRLTSLLTNDESKSGAYLVTGFRGMGKTSLVNNVIANVTTAGRSGNVAARYFRIMLLLLFLPLIEINWVTISINSALIVLLAFYLYRNALTMNNLSKNKSSWKVDLFLVHLRNITTISKEETSKFKLKIAIHDFLIVLMLRYCSTFVIFPFYRFYESTFQSSVSLENISDYNFALHVYLIVVLLSIIAKFVLQMLMSFKKESTFIQKVEYVWDNIWSAFMSFINKRSNYSHRIYVKINLGHDNLKEIDILRLIAKNIIIQFNEFSSIRLRFPLPDMPSLLFKILIIYTILSIIYLIPPIIYVNNVIKIKSGLVRYFPSQALFMLNNDNQSNFKTTLLNETDKNIYEKYISIFHETKNYKDGMLNKYGLENNIFYDARHKNQEETRSTTDNLSISGGQVEITSSIKINTKIGSKTTERNEIQKITNAIDMFINALYCKTVDILSIQPLWVIINELIYKHFIIIHKRYQFFPHQVDYLFIGYFILLWFLGTVIFRYKLFGFSTFGSVRKNITELNDSINAQVTRESGAEAAVGKYRASFFRMFGKQNKMYPRADAREIEKQLIDILNEIDAIPRLIKRPQFIFVFDELDKIEPQLNILEKEEVLTSTGGDGMPFSNHETRKRQQVILKILSNLKYFLTTAKAKFIFIAGREMYDASLADVSDRNYFMGSIFHDVIYVNSFLTDSTEHKLHDITNMTEQYVCKYLIPNFYIEKTSSEYSIKTYRGYLQDEIFKIDRNKPEEYQIKKLKIEKLLVTVNNFITYLTYRSNGSPKKLTRYFEKHVVQADKRELKKSDNLCVARNSNNLYLEFGFFDQYTLGLVSYIATPVILAIERAIKDFGDKILVSTSFIVDHIYKYHRHAFTWRSLEVTPEILDINKAPELREHIERIMQFLSKNNIHEILSGPYHFRFIKKTADEISYLSKISERESAAFNFTLDESIALKRHYKAYQMDLEKKYADSFAPESILVIKSISFVRMILGELHFYDEEYHDAIVELLESIQQLSTISEVEKMDVSTFYIYIRAMMLLGLAYEKAKSFNSAFTTYGKTTSIILDYKDKVVYNQPNSPISLFENKRHLYQPLLAKLQIIEKKGLNGITFSDLVRIEEEHNKLIGKNFSEKFIIESEFFCKLGDILYYKNGVIPGNDSATLDNSLELQRIPSCMKRKFCLNALLPLNPTDIKKIRYPCRACDYYIRSLKVLCRDHLGIQITGDVLDAKEYLPKMLTTIVRDDSADFSQKNVIASNAIGNILSNMGDTFLSCVKPKHIDNVALVKFLESTQEDNIANNVDTLNSFIADYYDKDGNGLYRVLVFYCASALFFITGRMHKDYSFQFAKILHLIKQCLNTQCETPSERETPIITCSNNLIYMIGKTIIKRIIQGIYRSYENVHRLEIEKIEKILETSNDITDYNNISLSGDIREILISYSEIKLKCKCSDVKLKDNFISPYTTIYTMRNRIIELNFKVNMNEKLFADLTGDTTSLDSTYRLIGNYYDPINKISYNAAIKFRELIDEIKHNRKEIIRNTFDLPYPQTISPEFVIEFLITDSIFCLREVIKICKTYGFSYDRTHSDIASAHLKLAIWCDYYTAYKDYDKGIEKTLEKLIGMSEMETINPRYQYEMARYHCLCAIETHSERKSYKNIIETMYYLNDDFNDSLYHFYAALERFMINTKQIEQMITISRERTQKDKLYDPKNYHPQPEKSINSGFDDGRVMIQCPTICSINDKLEALKNGRFDLIWLQMSLDYSAVRAYNDNKYIKYIKYFENYKTILKKLFENGIEPIADIVLKDYANTQLQPPSDTDIIKYLLHLQSMGYRGWCYKMEQGSTPEKIAIYNEKTRPTFSVLEYDNNEQDKHRDMVWKTATPSWDIETASCIFDIKTRNILTNMTDCLKLYIEEEPDKVPAPKEKRYKAPGLIGDTTDGIPWKNKAVTLCSKTGVKNTNIEKGYVYILTHPGIPTVHWQHYFNSGDALQNKIKQLINARKEAGVHSGSKLHIQNNACQNGVYAAMIEGNLGQLYVRIGGDDSNWHHDHSDYKDTTLSVDGTKWKVWVLRKHHKQPFPMPTDGE